MAYGRAAIFTKVFRDEDTIGRGIESILNQTYRDFKYYVMVNDETGKKVEKYAQKDERVEIVYGITGEKASFKYFAKTMAADEAGFDYMASMDADDWYDSNWLEVMVDFMEKNSLDVAACGSRFADMGDNTLGYRRIESDVCVDIERFPLWFPKIFQFCRTIWGKLYSREVILAYDPADLPGSDKYGGYGGDTIFVLELLKGAKRIGVTRKILHNYQVSPESSTYTYFAKGRLQAGELLFRTIEDFLKRYGEISQRNRFFMYSVYLHAVEDTVGIVLKSMKGREQARAYYGILSNELTIRAILSRNEEFFDKKDIFIRYITVLMLACLHYLKEEEKKECISLLCQIQDDTLMKCILQDEEFVERYTELACTIGNQENEKAMETCRDLLASGRDVFGEDKLIEILLNLAALSGDEDNFILGKCRKLKYLVKKQDMEQAEQEYLDLIEMGVAKEELESMKIYAKEQRKK